MGTNWGTLDTKPIWDTLLKLNERYNVIKETNGKVYKYIRDQILQGLKAYSIYIKEASTNKKLKQEDAMPITDFIEKLSKLWEKIAVKKSLSEQIPDWIIKEDPNCLKKYLHNMCLKFKNNMIQQKDYETFFTDALFFSLHLDKLTKGQKVSWRGDELAAHTLLLDLYVRAPMIDSFRIPRSAPQLPRDQHIPEFHEILKNLHTIENHLDTFNVAKVQKEDLGEILDLIEKITSAENTVIQKTENCSKQIHHLIEGNPHQESQAEDKNSERIKKEDQKTQQVLANTKEFIQQTKENLKKIQLPTEESFFVEKDNKLLQIVDYLIKVPAAEEEIRSTIRNIYIKLTDVLVDLRTKQNENKEIIQAQTPLQEIEDDLKEIEADSDIDLKLKRKYLNKFTAMINSISVRNDEIQSKKGKLINRMEGLIVVETANSLKVIQKKLCHYKKYVLQFPYPRKDPEYSRVMEEIASLRESLEDIPMESKATGDIVKTINIMIDDVLYNLHTIASKNDAIIARIEILEKLQQSLTNLQPHHFNEVRGRLHSVESLNLRIKKIKEGICLQLQQSEQSMFAGDPSLQKFIEIKLNLDKDEIALLMNPHLLTEELFGQTKQNLLNLRQNLNLNVTNNRDINNMLLVNVSHLQEAFIRTFNENKYSLQCSMFLNDMKEKILKVTSLKELQVAAVEVRYELTSMKNNSNEALLRNILEMEDYIIDKQSKLQMVEIKLKLEQFKRDFVDKSKFKSHVEELISYKSYIENMSEGDPDLDKEKELCLTTIKQFLANLDRNLAEIAYSSRNLENILDLHQHFKDDLKEHKGSKDTMEYVDLIRSKVDIFEKKVNYYLGTSESVDYYVIYENLVRLLEELDNVSCHKDKELLTKTVGTMEYIKELIKKLEENASLHS